ncbi:MAG TPA: hypothetical protein VIW29_16975 [Polyangiaceae bacterium]
MRPASLLLLAALSAAFGCRSTDRFNTSGEAAYCGDIVYAPAFTDGFLVDGEPPRLRMQLTLDLSQLHSSSEGTTLLGSLSSNDAETGLCSEQGHALFDGARVRAIPQVDHDTISSLTFGEGHDEDFFAYVDSTCLGTMLALVSLLRNGDVELRLFKPAALPASDASAKDRPGFALFSMKRNESGCGF